MKTTITFLLFLFYLGLNAQTAIAGDYELVDNITINGKTYTIYSKSNTKKFQFKVLENGVPHETTEYTNGINANEFLSFFSKFIKLKFDPALNIATLSDDVENNITQLINKIQVVERKKSDAKRTELENLLFKAEEDKIQYSAKMVLAKEVPFKISAAKSSKSKGGSGNNTMFTDIGKTKATETTTDTSTKKWVGTLKIIDAKITFFNNKASTIYIRAELTRNKVKEEIIFINNQYSVALRYFNRYGSTVTTEANNRDKITIDYNDVFDYQSDQFFNYSIANSQISMSNVKGNEFTNSARIIQRRFFDFFTAIVYSDLMGFNTENSNPLLNAQAKLLVPLNLVNFGKWSFGRQFTTTANMALSNSFEDENRYIAITDDENFSNFELLKRNNMYGEIGIDVLSHEAKGWFTNISLGYNAKFYRTGFRYTQTEIDAIDTVTNKQILSIGHGPFLNFEIRPQNNFGADVSFSLEDLNFADTNTIKDRSFNNDLITETESDHFLFTYNMINVNASFYWLTSPEKSKGGIYANLGGFFNTETNSIFPQLMVGYATNLTSFVNRFKSTKTTTAVKATE